MSESDPLQSYNWEDADGWQVLWKKVDQDTLNNKSPAARENWIRKKKAKWYKQNVDPEYEPPKVETPFASTKPPSSAYVPPRSSTQEKPAHSQSQSQRSSTSSTSWSPSWSWYFYLVCHCWCLGAAPFVFVTRARAYKSIIIVNAMLYGYFMKTKHGMPRFTADYAQQLFTDENTFHVIYPLMCFLMNPGLLWLSPLLLRSLPLGNSQLKKLMFSKAHGMYLRCKPAFKYIDERQGNFTSTAGVVEVWIAVAMIPGALFLKYNSLLQAMVFWQYMRMKYMMSESCRYAFRQVNASIRQKLPGAVLGYYDTITGYLHRMGDMQSQANAGRSCNIM